MEQQGKIDKAKEEYQQGENKLMQERRRLNRELNKQNYRIMALFHFSLGHIKRTAGHTAIEAAAYRAGEKLYDSYYGET